VHEMGFYSCIMYDNCMLRSLSWKRGEKVHVKRVLCCVLLEGVFRIPDGRTGQPKSVSFVVWDSAQLSATVT